MKRARLFGSHLSRRQRRVYGAVGAFYVIAALANTWPIYSLFGVARPMILGMPLSLVYVAAWAVGSFLVLLALFEWEGRQDGTDSHGAHSDGADSERRGEDR